MINYLPYIFGLPSLLGGLYLFLFSFRLYKPKHKTEEQKERYEKSLEKFGTLMKVCSVILILNGYYNLVMRAPDKYRVGNRNSNSNSEWTSEDRTIFIKNCMRTAGPTATNYPQITKEYCECSMDKIMKAMTKEHYEKSLSKPKEEQVKEVLPLLQDCIDELKRHIDSVERKTAR